MSKKFKSQASSARAASSAFGSPAAGFGGFGSQHAFATASSPLSYVAELPDLSQISNPQVVVTFKNLFKKDSVTKAKAIEDLQEQLTSADVKDHGVEDGILEAWINIYPRTSIDNSRRVRQLAHSFQGFLAASSGKRIARHLPIAIGAWLAGLYDSDKLVSRSAQDAFASVFATEEKRENVWKVYQKSILSYTEDTLLSQTPQSLSDERTVSPDDAVAKHSRVVGSSLYVLKHLLARLSSQDIENDRPDIEALLRSKKLWEFATHADPYVRRSVYDLLATCIPTYSNYVDWDLLSNYIIGKALHTNQLGSTQAFSEALLVLTDSNPQLWTLHYSSKTRASKRLLQFLSKGSQRGTSQFWSNISQLLRKLPAELWADDSTPSVKDGKLDMGIASAILGSFHEGLANPDEPRQNLFQAWNAYINTCFWLTDKLQESSDSQMLLRDMLVPMLEQYVLPTDEMSRWTLRSPAATDMCRRCLRKLVVDDQQALVTDFWKNLTDRLIENMKLSAPEQSHSFKSSQDTVISSSQNYMSLEAQLLVEQPDKLNETPLISVFDKATSRVIREAAGLLQTRSGKPYGAAGVLLSAIQLTPQFAFSEDTANVIYDFIRNEIPKLLSSPSADLSLSILFACRGRPGFDEALASCIAPLSKAEKSRQRDQMLHKLVSNVTAEEYSRHPELRQSVLDDLDHATSGDATKWQSIEIAVKNQALDAIVTNSALETLMESLTVEDKEEGAVNGLQLILAQNKAAMKTFMNSSEGSKILSRLLYLSESPNDNIAHNAEALARQIRSLIAEDGSEAASKSSVEIVLQNLNEVTTESLSIQTVVDLALEILTDETSGASSGSALEIFPTDDQWKKALEPFNRFNPPQSTAITSPLGGVVYLIDRTPSAEELRIARDSEGFSASIRLVLFAVKLLARRPFIIKHMDNGRRAALFLYLPLGLQFIDDNLSIAGVTPVWDFDSPEVEREMVDLLFEGRHLLNSFILSSMTTDELENKYQPNILSVWEAQLPFGDVPVVAAYQRAKAFTDIFLEALESAGRFKHPPEWNLAAQGVRSSPDVFGSASLLAVLKDSLIATAAGKRLCNELISDATGIDYQVQRDEGIRKISLLNLLLQGEDEYAGNIPTQRLVFLVKHLVTSLQSGAISLPLISEILKLLSSVLPQIREIYGSHWQDILEFVAEFWSAQSMSDEGLPALHSSLRLYSHLKSLASGESNDDLEEAWSATLPALSTGLLDTLKQFDDLTHNAHQPRAIVTDLLARLVRGLSLVDLVDETQFYPLLFVEQPAIQGAAYDLLHRFVPVKQEQVSFDTALSKTDAHLPEELLSLLLNAPTMEPFSGGTIGVHQSHWLGLRRYLLSWKVVFDHFTNASYKVRADYVNDIRESGHLTWLLDFVVDFLKISESKPIDASKFEIQNFELDLESSTEKEMQWLLIHLYYLCLSNVPNLTKTWWLDTKKRIKAPVEGWTQKFVSPIVISSALSTVSEWTKTLDPTDDRPVQVKISPKAAEIVASIRVDEESPPISLAINLAGAYPLQPALVTSRNRVLVDEKKWRSWLLTIQGVIMFSNGSLIDGLMAFRKNVQGALKGHTECAICYSIVSADMQTPSKRCGTCKQIFHSSCLFRWFKSSNSSSCPLCRNSFNYA